MTPASASWRIFAALDWDRARFRMQRRLERLRSPRRLMATMLAAVFLCGYLGLGITVLANREAADPASLQLWLSGGMVIYAMYHTVKLLWAQTNSQEQPSAASQLWLGGGPIDHRLLIVRDALRSVPSCLAKTVLLAVVLAHDVPSLISLFSGVFLALITLEWTRKVIATMVSALSPRENRVFKVMSLVVGLAVLIQISNGVWIHYEATRDPVQLILAVIAEVATFAASDPVQWLAAPLWPASSLAVGQALWEAWGLPFVLQAFVAILIAAGCLRLLIAVESWSHRRKLRWEQASLARVQRNTIAATSNCLRSIRSRQGIVTRWQSPFAALVSRQWHCVGRYRTNVLLSFAIPMALSLSPLLTDQGSRGWIFVIGGIALSSLLLAPPALQIDFRRDLRRMTLLRSLPVGPWETCLAMLILPVAITVAFQWSTLLIASSLSQPTTINVIWLALALPCLAVVTFAVENALFLAFPHHVHDQGIAMVVRAKVTFLWKGLLLAVSPLALLLWATFCRTLMPTWLAETSMFVGSLLGLWSLALASIAGLVACWKRFDPVLDIPPE